MGATVVHVITALGSGGAERMLGRIATYPYGAGGPRQIVVSLMDEGFHGAALRDAGVEVHCLGLARARLFPLAYLRLVRLLRRIRPDVVMSWLYHADLLALLATPLAGRPPLVWNLRCSSIDLDRHPVHTRRVVSLLARLSGYPDVVASNSVVGRHAHEALGYAPRRWVLLPNGFETDIWRKDCADRAAVRAKLGLDQSDIAIVMVARVDPEKDHETFLAAAEQVAERVPAARFVLIGQDTERLDVGPALEGRLTALGERRDVERLLRGFDIAVLCSRSEGFPNTVGEAMATGLPCVVTDVGDAATIVGDTGMICPPGDPGALAAALEQLIGAGGKAIRQRGELARRRIVETYSVDRAAACYLDLWNEVIRR